MTWYITFCPEICNTDKYYILGDTDINGKKYYKYRSDEFNAYLREDTINKKVYIKDFQSLFVKDTTEILYYDFNLAEGNSILQVVPYHGKLDTIGLCHLDSVRQITTTVGKRDIFYLTNTSIPANYNVEIIESFGLFNYYIYSSYWLHCFYRGNIKEFESDTSECDYYGGADIKTNKTEELKIYWISNDRLKIMVPDYSNSFHYNASLVDLKGRIIRQFPLSLKETIIDLANVPKGVYIISLINKKNSVSKKIIK